MGHSKNDKVPTLVLQQTDPDSLRGGDGCCQGDTISKATPAAEQGCKIFQLY